LQDLPANVLPVAADARLEVSEGRHRVTYSLPIPYFWPLWAPLVARRARRIEAAADRGEPLPSDLPWWAPPAAFDAETSRAIACVCLIALLAGYASGRGGLLTQTLPYAADVYDVGDRSLGLGLAIVRGGVLLALVVAVFADRIGRRRVVIPLAVAHCLLGAGIGFAPDFGVYIGAHTALRTIDTSLNVALGVLLVERLPAGSRAIGLALFALAGGAGIALAVCALPLAAVGRGGFTAAYLLQILAIPLVLHAGRRLRESPRFVTHAREPHRYGELLRGRYRRHLLVVGGATFCGFAFAAPGVEFANRYLDDVHGFSSLGIVAFLAVTGAPALPMLAIGGRLADLWGRKATAVPFLAIGTLALAGFYLVSGPWLWPLALAGTALSTCGGIALAPYASELFPTRVRAAANTAILAIGVLGSATGLAVAGLLSDRLGVGGAIASLGVLQLVAVAIVALRFPETARLELEETSGEAGTRAPAEPAPSPQRPP
jgi:predicted MFS family arabinose efflux permease